MNAHSILVTIGIPTYNRAQLLMRTLESVLRQTHTNLEIIVSDNASTDETAALCHAFAQRDSRLRYVRNTVNIGGTKNFAAVLALASSKYFMWLGDDDYLDDSYVENCLRVLASDADTVVVCGLAKYLKGGSVISQGRCLSLLHISPWRRLIDYYRYVTDNGTFYGLMRTEELRKVRILNTLGGDWLIVAGLAFLGKIRTVSSVVVYRELGGATASYSKICRSLGISRLHGLFPDLSVAVSAFCDIAFAGPVYRQTPLPERLLFSAIAFVAIASRPLQRYLKFGGKSPVISPSQ